MRISTRSSKLALKQVDIFLNNLDAKSLVPEIKKQITSGDIKSQKGENVRPQCSQTTCRALLIMFRYIKDSQKIP